MRLTGRVRKLERAAQHQAIPWHELAAYISRQMAASLTGGDYIEILPALMPYRNNLLYSTMEEHKRRCVYAGD